MSTKIFHQIKNEWRSNLWLFTELLLVSVILWYAVDWLYVITTIKTQPKGFDISHCYNIEMGMLGKDANGYDAADTVTYQDILELASRLRKRSDVEGVALSGMESYPYAGSYWGTVFRVGKLQTNIQASRRHIFPSDFFKVFRYRGANGETPEQLAAMVADGRHCLLSDNIILQDSLKKRIVTARSMIGKKIDCCGNGDSLVVAGTIVPAKRSEYEDNREHGTCVYQGDVMERGKYSGLQVNSALVVRVKAKEDHNFTDKVWKVADKQYRVGNVYISNIQSFKEVRKTFVQDELNQERLYKTGLLFLLVNIFLGLLGTFWFRTQQRSGEIALLKAMGADNKNVFFRQIKEGILLLTLATIPAIIIDVNLAYIPVVGALNGIYLSVSRLMICIAITYALMAIVIVLGILMPARKAMRIQPAAALHED